VILTLEKLLITKMRKRLREPLNVGDTVTHLLYGKEWIGIVVEIEEIEKGFSAGRKNILVHMVPGSEHCNHFDKAFSKKIASGRGWITSNWLLKVDLNN